MGDGYALKIISFATWQALLNSYDTIVIGAGHNGLVCATLLARSGQKVLVLEASQSAGGLASTREFHPGFSVSVAHSVSHIATEVAQELKLAEHGYQVPEDRVLNMVGLNLTGEHVVISGDGVAGVGAADSAKYLEYRTSMLRFANALRPSWLKTMPTIGNNSFKEMLTFGQLGLRMRLLGKEHMLEFMRVATLPMRDLMDENFDNELLKAALSWDGLIGMKMAPRSPNSAVFALLYRMSSDAKGMHSLPIGGITALVDALESSASGAGVDIRYDAPVGRVVVEGDESGQRVAGVELADGELIAADRVVSSADPKRTFIELVGPQHLEIEFTSRVQRLRTEGYVAKLHLALSGLPKFSGLASPEGRLIIAPTLDHIEFAYDDAKYGGPSSAPVLECLIPTLYQSGLAPEGQHVLSAHVMYIPANVKGGWTEESRSALLKTLLETLEAYAPGMEDLVIQAELLTPQDLESSHRVTGGHWHHAEFAVDQMLMMRPTYEAAQYHTPIPGLYLCGAGSHPGGDLMGGPGYNAAREILK
ncbi:MAG: phytoene dehydrogenase-like protein [Halieaceae bacterium]|jgi:phytoene dehydrogenase-like protein